MPYHTRTVDVMICDRCSFKAEYPDPRGFTAGEMGWIQFDLTRSIKQPGPVFLRERNEQVLCPKCVHALRVWFEQ